MIPNPAYNNQVLVDIWLEIQPIKIELSFVQKWHQKAKAADWPL